MPENTQPPDPLDLYRIAIEEYRFQVTLNWNRSQYYLVLNLGVLSAATAISTLKPGSNLPGVVFLIGIATAVVAILANRIQKQYYLRADANKDYWEWRLAVACRIDATKHVPSGFWPYFRVTTLNSVLLALIACADLAGAIYVFVLGTR